MPLDYQLARIPFGQGVAEHIAAEILPPDKLLTARNAIIDKKGTIGKRPGTEAMPSTVMTGGTAIARGFRVAGLGDEAIITDGERLYTYLEQVDEWRQIDKTYEATINLRITGERGVDQVGASCDVVYVNGHYVVGWEVANSDYIYARPIDAATGARLPPIAVYAPSNNHIRLLAIGNVAYFLYYDSTNVDVVCLTYDTLTKTWSGPVVLANHVHAGAPQWEAYASDSYVYVAHNYSLIDTTGIQIHRWNAALTGSVNAIRYTEMASREITVCAHSGSYVWVAYDEGSTNLTLRAVTQNDDATLSNLAGPSNIGSCFVGGTSTLRRLGSQHDGAGECLFVYELRSVGVTMVTRELRATLRNPTLTDQGHHRTYHVGLVSQPIYWGGKWYCCAYFFHGAYAGGLDAWTNDDGTTGGGTQRFGYLVEILTSTGDEYGRARVVTRFGTWQLGDPLYMVPSNLWPVASNRYVLSCPVKTQAIEVDVTEGFDCWDLEFLAESSMHLSDSVQNELLLSGGSPALYDGYHCSELGFHFHPIVDEQPYAGVAGALTPSTTYRWAVVYEWIDGKGVWHRSMPQYTDGLALAAGENGATMDVFDLTLTEHIDTESVNHPVRICFYRTEANGSVFYFEAAYESDPRSDYQTHNSILADTVIRDNRMLYSEGGVLPDLQPPAMLQIIRHGVRLWGISGDNPDIVWMSKIDWQDYVMPGFPAGFVIRLPMCVTALASMDDKLVIFGEDSIWLLTGDGPNDQGEQNDLNGPRKLAVATGCIERRSVVVMPGGILFQSRDGIKLLSRGLDVVHVGEPVRTQLETHSVCSACLVEYLGIVLVATQSSTGLSGYLLAYHYEDNEWTTWDLQKSGGGSDRALSQVVCNRDGEQRWHAMLNDGTVCYLVDADFYEHTAIDLPYIVGSGWIALSGLQGYKRVRRIAILGKYHTACSVTIRIYYDYQTTAATTISMTVADVANAVSQYRFQKWVHVSRTCEAVRVSLQTEPDPAAPSTRETITWESLVVEAGGKPGIFRLPIAARG